MAKITGFGGAFLRADDPEALSNWYLEVLGIGSADGYFVLPKDNQPPLTVAAFRNRSCEDFPAAQPAMLAFQVDDLDAVLLRLSAAGVSVEPKCEHPIYGQFGSFTDPEGNRVELWQPAASLV
jgi:predicted enzyme related to lactoylglutathione lyase